MSVQIEAQMAELKQLKGDKAELTAAIEEKNEETKRLELESQQSQGCAERFQKLVSKVTEKDEKISNLVDKI